MPPGTPFPYITKIGRDADQWADMLTSLVCLFAVVFTAWFFGHRAHLFVAPPEGLRLGFLGLGVLWFVFKTLACLIDYAIFALVRVTAEILVAVQSPHLFEQGAEGPPATEQNATISYLADVMARKRAMDPDLIKGV